MAYKKKEKVEVSETEGQERPGVIGALSSPEWIAFGRANAIQSIATQFVNSWLLSPKEGKYFDGLAERAVNVAKEIVDRSAEA